jgi:hypothetical protein
MRWAHLSIKDILILRDVVRAVISAPHAAPTEAINGAIKTRKKAEDIEAYARAIAGARGSAGKILATARIFLK